MKPKIAFIGGGGFAKELKSYLTWENRILNSTPINIFVESPYLISGQKDIRDLKEFDPRDYTNVFMPIGDSETRARIYKILPESIILGTFVSAESRIYDYGNISLEGLIVCPRTTITVDVKVGSHCHFNIGTTVGHGTTIGSYFTSAPGVHISGNCNIGDRVYIGTNASVKPGVSICSDVTIGLNAGVTEDISIPGVYVGTPAKLLRK